MRLIDADALMPLFIEKANTTDKHGVKFGENWLLDYEDIKDVIDNAPTVNTTCPNCDSGYAQGYSDGYLKGKEERPIDDLSEYSDKLWQKAYERGKVERPQGHWIKHISNIECSNCGEKFYCEEDENCQDYEPCNDFLFNFCPNCGTEMTKEAENE